ncbi:FadR family transcriptional regulator [Marinihelvus fidelis]|uniref:FadR family transcriptional regulator n=1 Tax=Marinihelvus fidelis TaxID=2613842 RepID=A0A5N0T6T0_9GAMM|nr:FadR/GntR family transcriptional regulator [Marinihelvus fidelis]KAA9130501.1 FadR family transcriptional regulator [Marinihelvus fidelis]
MSSKRLYHTVAERIKRGIADGTYPPGTRLPGERELAQQFQVSRVTIREAEIALQALGQVIIKTGSGVYVTDPAERGSLVFPEMSLFELTEAQSMFESEAAALAARNIEDTELTELVKLGGVLADNQTDDMTAVADADKDFHIAIAKASGNAAVLFVVKTLWKIRTELADSPETQSKETSGAGYVGRVAVYKAILKALEDRDSSAARQAMLDHFRHLLTFLIDLTEEKEMQVVQQRSSWSRKRYLHSRSPGHSN